MQITFLRFSPKNIIVPSDDKVMRDEKMKKKAEEKAAKESKEDVYDEVFDLDHDDEYYGHQSNGGAQGGANHFAVLEAVLAERPTCQQLLFSAH